MEWKKALVEVGQFGVRDVAEVFKVARGIEAELEKGKVKQVLAGKVLANLFYEPSTRTSSSFYAAMARQGGSVIPINDVNYSSVSKGETLSDTVRTLACYADVIALRHPEDDAAARAAEVCPVPIINAGNGKGEHPTQALLDLFTIERECGRLSDLKVVLMGDLKHGRTVRSLVQLLRPHGAKVTLVAPHELQLGEDVKSSEDVVRHQLGEALRDADVLYVTRVQKERLSAELVAKDFTYTVGIEEMARANAKMVLMHPLPRVGEIDAAVDGDARAAYFRQMRYGMVVRMALLRMMVGV